MFHHDAEPPFASRLDTMLAAQPSDAMAPAGLAEASRPTPRRVVMRIEF
jgi:hypothetical protein